MATPTIVGTRRVQSGGESTGAYPSLFARMVDRLSGSFWVKLLLSMLELLCYGAPPPRKSFANQSSGCEEEKN